MSGKPVYVIRAERWQDWWSLVVPELSGVATQSRRLDQAKPLIREVIELVVGESAHSYDLTLEIVDADINTLVQIATDTRATVERLTTQSRELQAEIVERLRARGLPLRDIGELLGVSHQRVAQIEKSDSEAATDRDDLAESLEELVRLMTTLPKRSAVKSKAGSREVKRVA